MKLVLHEDPLSGNCYKIRLTASLLGFPLERLFYDIRSGETRSEAFLREVNPNGRIPVLQIEDRFLPESNAACWFLAFGTPLVPTEPFEQADVLRWMFWEQYNHEPNVATVRYWLEYVGEANLTDLQRAQIPGKVEAGKAALALMNDHLTSRDWFVGNRVTLADIALHAYTHVCEEGGVYHLSDYPAIQRWIARIAGLPGYTPIRD